MEGPVDPAKSGFGTWSPGSNWMVVMETAFRDGEIKTIGTAIKKFWRLSRAPRLTVGHSKKKQQYRPSSAPSSA
jgi:hypothetical protein